MRLPSRTTVRRASAPAAALVLGLPFGAGCNAAETAPVVPTCAAFTAANGYGAGAGLDPGVTAFMEAAGAFQDLAAEIDGEVAVACANIATAAGAASSTWAGTTGDATVSAACGQAATSVQAASTSDAGTPSFSVQVAGGQCTPSLTVQSSCYAACDPGATCTAAQCNASADCQASCTALAEATSTCTRPTVHVTASGTETASTKALVTALGTNLPVLLATATAFGPDAVADLDALVAAGADLSASPVSQDPTTGACVAAAVQAAVTAAASVNNDVMASGAVGASAGACTL
jgi:hypothetical protein